MKKLSLTILVSTLLLQAIGQQGNYIHLSANGDITDTISRGEPLLLELVLMNREARSAASWNLAAERRLGQLKELLDQKKITDSAYQKEKTELEGQLRKSTTIRWGSSGQPWTQLARWTIRSISTGTIVTWPVQLLRHPKPQDVAVLDENAYYISYFGVDPAGMNLVPAGEYILQVTINNYDSDPVRIQVVSSPVNQEDLIQLGKTGNFYRHAGDAPRALAVAEKILSINPRSLNGLVLKGDAMVLQRSFLPALEVYNLALKEYGIQAGEQAEPPDYILNMISFIKAELGGN
jgi:hypothetical protein